MANTKKYTIRTRIWIDEETGPFLGIGRVILLQKIKETGSITNAAKAIKMSYRQAWQLVEDMNTRSNLPLVEKILGGKTGGGAKITKAGENAIAQFYALEKRVIHFIKSEAKNLKL
ncbi:MAG: LysR family transcriptional regulator [Sphingobacteriaceae bacterium]|nr:LysR family transcriptional regulator [Sphingobacteriaceae bacterium]